MHENELEKDERVIAIARTYQVEPAEVAKMVGILQEAFMSVVQAINELANIFRFFLEENKDNLTELLKELKSRDEELSREWKRDLHKMEFARPKIRHQVLDRKPKNLIKKIIH